MNRRDAIAMFEGADLSTPAPSTWADLGCGDGTFTMALASLLAPGSVIHAIDRDASAVARVPAALDAVRIETHVADFTRSWPFSPAVDGILMANSLHYVRDQRGFLRACLSLMSEAGRFLIVEYDTFSSSPWVPFPIGRDALQDLFSDIGTATVLGTRRSTYGRARLYAAMVTRRAPAIA
jgi:trans-aconitate methyltransferase